MHVGHDVEFRAYVQQVHCILARRLALYLYHDDTEVERKYNRRSPRAECLALKM